jgi:MFS family permease
MLIFGTLPYGLSFALTLYAQEVLGYSAVRFGLTSLVFPAMAALGSIFGQKIVLKAGFRPVAAAGMALMGGGALLLTQVSVDGTYFGDIFFGLLVFGPGVGLAFVTASIAALAGVPEREAGLASGLSNTSFQIGAALGVAVVSTVAISRTTDYLAGNTGANPQVALTEGFQSAFLAVAILAGIGVAVALLLLGRPRGRQLETAEKTERTAAPRAFANEEAATR